MTQAGSPAARSRIHRVDAALEAVLLAAWAGPPSARTGPEQLRERRIDRRGAAPDDRRVPLPCEACRELVPAANIHSETFVARCARCDAASSISRGDGAASAPRRLSPRPTGIVIESGEPALFEEGYRIPAFSEGATLVISRRWFRWQHLAFLMVALGWNVLVGSWYAVAVARDVPFPMFAAPLLLVAVGAAVTYYAATLLFNRTRVRVGDGKLEVRHGPVPWRAGVEVEIKRLRQIHLRRRCARGDGDSISSTWDVEAELGTRESILLVRRIPSREQAEYIGRTIEAHLGTHAALSDEQLD